MAYSSRGEAPEHKNSRETTDKQKSDAPLTVNQEVNLLAGISPLSGSKQSRALEARKRNVAEPGGRLSGVLGRQTSEVRRASQPEADTLGKDFFDIVEDGRRRGPHSPTA